MASLQLRRTRAAACHYYCYASPHGTYVATLLLTGIKALCGFGGKGQLLTPAQLLGIGVATWYPCFYVALGLCVVGALLYMTTLVLLRGIGDL